jgi:hypothetical protein
MNEFILGSYKDYAPPADATLMIADPIYGDAAMISDMTNTGIPSIVFMWPSDLLYLEKKPDQILHWLKPVSTKNTCKRYSNFIEVMACYDVEFHGKGMHWSTRTGVFTDTLLSNAAHAWKKPDSLIEKLILNHYCGHGTVYDPCAGSGTVHDVCTRLGIPSFSVEIDERYARRAS